MMAGILVLVTYIAIGAATYWLLIKLCPGYSFLFTELFNVVFAWPLVLVIIAVYMWDNNKRMKSRS